MIVVQRVEVRWTKRSRGAPAASVRNAVPEGFALPPWTAGTSGPLLLHRLDADEASGFAPTERVEAPAAVPDMAGAAGVGLTVAGGRLKVVRLPRYGIAHPAALQRRARHAFALQPGSWGRLRAIARYHRPACGCGGEWWYDKLVVNVAWLPVGPAPADLFLGRPAARLDELVPLR